MSIKIGKKSVSIGSDESKKLSVLKEKEQKKAKK